MDRDLLSDEQWARIAPLLPGKPGDPGRSGEDNRRFFEAILWLVRAGAPWRDLPARFGKWGTVWKRFRRWALKGEFERIFEGLVGRSGLRIRPGRRHHRQGPPPWQRRKGGTQNQAIGRSRGGLTTKIVALVDALGYLVRFHLLPGQRHDTIGLAPLLQDQDIEALVADKAFDNDSLRAALDERGAQAVIPSNGSRAQKIPYDKEIYKWRHLIENFFQKIKEFRRIAMRYDKTDTSYAAAIHLVAAFIAIK